MFPSISTHQGQEQSQVLDNLRAMADLRSLNMVRQASEDLPRRWAAFYALPIDTCIGALEVGPGAGWGGRGLPRRPWGRLGVECCLVCLLPGAGAGPVLLAGADACAALAPQVLAAWAEVFNDLEQKDGRAAVRLLAEWHLEWAAAGPARWLPCSAPAGLPNCAWSPNCTAWAAAQLSAGQPRLPRAHPFGGLLRQSNCLPCCPRSNVTKHAKLVEEEVARRQGLEAQLSRQFQQLLGARGGSQITRLTSGLHRIAQLRDELLQPPQEQEQAQQEQAHELRQRAAAAARRAAQQVSAAADAAAAVSSSSSAAPRGPKSRAPLITEADLAEAIKQAAALAQQAQKQRVEAGPAEARRTWSEGIMAVLSGLMQSGYSRAADYMQRLSPGSGAAGQAQQRGGGRPVAGGVQRAGQQQQQQQQQQQGRPGARRPAVPGASRAAPQHRARVAASSTTHTASLFQRLFGMGFARRRSTGK
jgi:hypothetical protein